MKIDAAKQKELLESINIIRNFIESLETSKSCFTCENWKNDGCRLADGQIPPNHIILSGCASWQIWDEIPMNFNKNS